MNTITTEQPQRGWVEEYAASAADVYALGGEVEQGDEGDDDDAQDNAVED